MQIPLHDPLFAKLAALAEHEHVDAYVVGGFVRDLFLKRESKDVDIVLMGDGIAFAEKFAATFPGKKDIAVFRNFGTAMVHAGDWQVEFVGARKESYVRESRKPTVEPGTLQDDQFRRDFTINALAISLNSGNMFELIDPFGGIADIENKIIRTPLDPRM